MNRFVIVTVAAISLGMMFAGGCGPKPPADSLDATGDGDRVVVEGTVSLRGSMPSPLIILQLADGTEMIVEPRDEFRGELRSLSGFRVAVRGNMMRKGAPLPRIEAARYELLRLPSGELPVLGYLRSENDHLVLVASDGKRFWIRGDLVGAIREYEGAKIWVVGSLGDAGAQDHPENAVAYWVTGYGVLQDAPGGRR